MTAEKKTEQGLGDALRSAAEYQDRPGAYDELRALADQADALQRGGAELGRILDDTLADVLNLSGAHHLIDSDGDGDWGAVWDILGQVVERGKRAVTVESLALALRKTWGPYETQEQRAAAVLRYLDAEAAR
jgi:hypothetical protein